MLPIRLLSWAVLPLISPQDIIPAPAEAANLPAYESINYRLKVGRFSVGRARLVLTSDTLNNLPLAKATFTVRGGIPFYRVRDQYDSWFDPKTFTTHRYRQVVNQGPYHRSSTFDFKDNLSFQENDGPPQTSVSAPIDDASFLYLIRTLPYQSTPLSITRYYRPDRNPITLTLIGRQMLNTPLGRVPTLIVRPTIKSRGFFSEGNEAKIWLTDDNRRLLVRLESNLSFGPLTLEMTEYSTVRPR